MTHETDTMIFREIATECIPCKVVDDIGNGLKTIQLTPDGDVKSLKGGFVIDEESAALIIKAFDEHDTEAVIDFEHQSLGGDYSPPSGLAPAAGWITKVFYEKGRGLFGQVRWNERARDFIRSGEYKYISPVLHVRKSDRRAVELHSAALTNVPAISGMEAVAASQRQSHKETGIMENGNPVETERLIGEMRAALTDAGVEIENVDDTAGILRAAIAAIKGKVGDKAEGDGSDSRAADSEAIASSVPPVVLAWRTTPAQTRCC